ncbi:MAG: metallophosphoesterase family protein [Dehalococcoidia bacterium]
MRIALISDVHANQVALEAVLADAGARGIDATWSLGDMVGYGPRPNEVLALLRDIGARCVLGNHDAAAVGLITTGMFNPTAAEAAEWTARALDEGSRAFLSGLPQVAKAVGVTLVHGTLHEPLWEYLITAEAARHHFDLLETRVSVVGHTHVPLVVWCEEGGGLRTVQPAHGDVVELGEAPVAVNPGGVGQPRDGDPRAAYAIFEPGANRVQYLRVAYDIETVQRQILDAGLPGSLAARLARGQ